MSSFPLGSLKRWPQPLSAWLAVCGRRRSPAAAAARAAPRDRSAGVGVEPRPVGAASRTTSRW